MENMTIFGSIFWNENRKPKQTVWFRRKMFRAVQTKYGILQFSVWINLVCDFTFGLVHEHPKIWKDGNFLAQTHINALLSTKLYLL
jgi:hypothetical protein